MNDELNIEKLRSLEERGRELTTELQLKGFSKKLGDKIGKWNSDVRHAMYRIQDELSRTATYDKTRIYRNFGYGLSELICRMNNAIAGCSGKPHTFKGEPVSGTGHLRDNRCYVGNGGTDWDISVMNEASIEMVGESCAYGKLGEEYSLPALTNDATSCYHRFLEEYDKNRKAERKVIGKCIIEEESDKDLIDACKEWDKTTEKFNENGLYEKDDYAAVHANIFGKKGEFTVGDSPGHRTHLNLDKGTVDYYDDDTPVNETMKRLFESAGLKKCKIKSMYGVGSEGVSCSGLNRKNVKKVSKQLAGATSMDFRVSTDGDIGYWKPLSKKLSGLKKCHIYDTRPEREACYVQTKIEANE
jgi:hypothetical protein